VRGKRGRLAGGVIALAACARVVPPAGGPTDLAPPVVIAAIPESVSVLQGFDGEVEFHFDEVVSEGGAPNFGLGTGDLEKLIVLSPSLAVPQVRWRRTRITVKPREGWRPNTVYRVELLPGVADLSANRTRAGRVITFTTGAPLPLLFLRGRVVDWSTRRPQPRGLVEAILLPDSLPYRALADSTGRFSLGPLPSGEYLVYGVLDQNNDFRMDRREAFDSVRIAAGRDSVGELWAFRHDSTPPRLGTVARHDSLTLQLTFSQSLNPFQRIPPESVEVRLLPDSTAVPVLAVLPKELFDSLYPPRPPAAADTSAAGRARADSLRADSLRRARADSLRADSIARAREAARIRIPGAEPERAPAARPDPLGPLLTRPATYDRLFVRLGERLRPGAAYVVTVHGVENLGRVAGSARGVGRMPEEAPPPARPDTGQARRR